MTSTTNMSQDRNTKL